MNENSFAGRKSISIAELKALPAADLKRLLGRTSGKRQKYHQQPTWHRGILFDSKWESQVYETLYQRQRAGEIYELRCQVPLEAKVKGKPVTTMTVDFSYRDAKTRRIVYAEAKSKATKMARDYPLRKRIIEAYHGITIEEHVQPGRRRTARPAGLRLAAKRKPCRR